MTSTEPNPIENSDISRDQGLAAAYWAFGIPAQDTLVEYHLRAHTYAAQIPETIRFIPDCPHPRTGLRYPTMIAKIENMRRDFSGVYLQYLNPNRIGRFIDDSTGTGYPDHDIIDWDRVNTGVRVGGPQTENRPWVRVAPTLEDALVAQQTTGGLWVYDTSCSWSAQGLPSSIRGYSEYAAFEINTDTPENLSGKRELEISRYRKLVHSGYGIAK